MLTGREIGSRSAGPFEISLVEHRGDVTLERHRHAEAVIGLLLSGVYDEWLDGRMVEPARASLLIKPPETPHANRIGRTGTQTVLIQVRPDRIPADLQEVLARPSIHIHARVAALGEDFLRELRQPGGASPIGLEALAYELLAIAHRGRGGAGVGYSPRQRWVSRVRERINDSLSEPASLADLAGHAGVERSHLARTFRVAFGCTVGEYVRAARLERAARRLRSGDEPLSRIALDLGFADQAHLTRTFRAAYGVPPGRYRRAG